MLGLRSLHPSIRFFQQKEGMKHKAQSIEIKWDKPEPFQLVIETTTDGDRIAKEKARLITERTEAETRQRELMVE
jgi:hypothetical protein